MYQLVAKKLFHMSNVSKQLNSMLSRFNKTLKLSIFRDFTDKSKIAD